MKKLSIVLLLMLSAFSLASCNGRQAELLDIKVDKDGISQEILIDDFNIRDLVLLLEYSNGEIEEIPLSLEMLSAADRQKLTEAGRHSITVNHERLSYTFELHIVYSPLTEQLMYLHQLGVESGMITDDYDTWLESIRGDDGVSIEDVSINMQGELIITLSDGEILNAGRVVAREMEIRVFDDTIQWRYKDETSWQDLVSVQSGKDVEMRLHEGAFQWRHVNGTWEDFLSLDELTRGDQGLPGREVLFQVEDGFIQWQYEGDTEWFNLVAIEEFMGPQGEAGREVEFRVDNSTVQWRYVGDSAWLDLVTIQPDREVEMRLSDGYFQWRQDGGSWANLLSLDELTRGDQGLPGSDGREVQFQVTANFIQWRYQGESSWRNLIALSQLVGPKGDQGDPGREVEFRVASNHIQWRHEGSNAWTNLIDIASLIGSKGNQGDDGTDGREAVFRIYEGFMQWQYVGEDTWSNLIELSTLTRGEDGLSAYEIYLIYHLDYVGDEETWLNDLITGRLREKLIFDNIELLHEIAEFGKTYTVRGHVLSVLNNGYLLSDGTHVINVYNPFNRTINEGDLIEVLGHYTEYYGKWQLSMIIQETVISVDNEVDFEILPITVQELWNLHPLDKMNYARIYEISGWLSHQRLLFDYEGSESYIRISNNLFQLRDSDFNTSNLVNREISILAYFYRNINDLDLDFTIIDVVDIKTFTIGIVTHDSEYLIFVNKDDLIPPIAEPLKEGHTFVGWYLDEDYTKAYEFTTMPAKDFTLYAKWEVNEYTITFETNGGNVIGAKKINYGEIIYLPSNPTKDNYEFSGWYLNGEKVETPFIYDFEHNIILEARWRPLATQITAEIIREPIRISSWGFNQIIVLDNFESLHLLNWSSHGTVSYIYDKLILDIPSHLQFDETIDSLDLTNDNLIMLTSNGRILTFGSNAYGQLGDGTFIDQYSKFNDITNLFNFEEGEFPIKASMADSRSGLLTNLGRVFLWGSTTFEVSDQQFYSRNPLDVTEYFVFENHEERVVDFYLATEKIFITNYNTIFGWGNPGGGGLGTGGLHAFGRIPVNFSNIYTNLDFDKTDQIVRSNIIWDGGSILIADNRLVVWGTNYYKQIYDGGWPYRVDPIELDISEIFNLAENEILIDVIEGYSRYYFVTNLGRIFLTGKSLVNPPGPNTYTIHSIQNPLELSFVLNDNDRLFNCCGDLTLYIDGQMKTTWYTRNTDEMNWFEINLPNKTLHAEINQNEEFDVFDIFELDPEYFKVISYEESSGQKSYVLRKISEQ